VTISVAHGKTRRAMAKVKILGRIGEFDEEYLPNLKAVVEKAGGTFLRLRIIPNSEHWLEYHCRFRNKVKGLRKFARNVVQLDSIVVEERKKENERRAAEGQELLPEIEPLPTTWPNEERRARAGEMLEQFLENNSLMRHDLQAPIGTYERDVACDKVKEFLHRLKWELKKAYEDMERSCD
jgi:hypothetical protein